MAPGSCLARTRADSSRNADFTVVGHQKIVLGGNQEVSEGSQTLSSNANSRDPQCVLDRLFWIVLRRFWPPGPAR